MTRRSAGVVARGIVAVVRREAAAKGQSDAWTEMTVHVVDVAKELKRKPLDLLQTIDESFMVITGCLPMGWRITGKQGDTNLTVARSF